MCNFSIITKSSSYYCYLMLNSSCFSTQLWLYSSLKRPTAFLSAPHSFSNHMLIFFCGFLPWIKCAEPSGRDNKLCSHPNSLRETFEELQTSIMNLSQIQHVWVAFQWRNVLQALKIVINANFTKLTFCKLFWIIAICLRTYQAETENNLVGLFKYALTKIVEGNSTAWTYWVVQLSFWYFIVKVLYRKWVVLCFISLFLFFFLLVTIFSLS